VISNTDEIISRLSFKLSVNTIHLATKPMSGGIPAKLPTTIICVLLLGENSLGLIFFCQVFFISIIMKITDNQYIPQKSTNNLKLIKILTIIHLKLKMEERARISMINFLFSWDTLPTKAEAIKKISTNFFN